MSKTGAPRRVEEFIQRWQGRHGGQERANYAMFLCELCDALDVTQPDPAGHPGQNDYVFERAVKETSRDGVLKNRRIDLYKRDCFVLEAKQSRQIEGGAKQITGQPDLFAKAPEKLGIRPKSASWDILMNNARAQGEGYTRLLPQGHEPPPFLIVCDVGHCFEIYANFRRDGKAFDQFPDRRAFRIYLEDLRSDATRELLSAIWTDPLSLDPARKSARVTREIAERLAAVSKALEIKGCDAEDVAMFLMRCLFTMFAEDVSLLPEKSFKQVLERCEEAPQTFPHDVGQLWEVMDRGGYAHAIRQTVPQFNGAFFKQRKVLPLGREEIGELRQAASHDWREVDPSIFGTLLEQALDPNERRKLGAHYTPRAYVERLVIATVIEPLRDKWKSTMGTIARYKDEAAALGLHDPRRDAAIRKARALAMTFHAELCLTRVLDPACGTGNFLYVALELMKRLEGEVVDAVEALGGQEEPAWLDRQNVDPHQFLGMEVNPRAGAIAELVLWIGFLQWHFRTCSDPPPPPILKAFKNISVMDAVLEADKALARDERGKPLSRPGPDGKAEPIYRYDKPRRPQWPEADYIVGNPPFIGKGEPMRETLGGEYVNALDHAHVNLGLSVDFVMYWWNYAADILTQKETSLKRFGFVTTNSITQIMNRKVMTDHLKSAKPISIIMAVPDHPWKKGTKGDAAVRIAMTVAEAGIREGILRTVTQEIEINSEIEEIEFNEQRGIINPDLTIGTDVTSAIKLRSNHGLASMGPALGGRGFILSSDQANAFRDPNSDTWLKLVTSGKDITQRHRNRYVFDLRAYEKDEDIRHDLPIVYQHIKLTVYPERERNPDPKLRAYWWRYRRSNDIYFSAVGELNRFIATVETTSHRVFVFIEKGIVEHGVIGFGLDDAYSLGVLSSSVHIAWALSNGGTLEDRPRYNKDVCFDPFPFPLATPAQKKHISAIAEELDTHRKRVLADHAHLTLTGLYNVLERLRAGATASELEEAERRIFDDGLVLIMKELHDELDEAVASAYGWPADLPAEDMLARLVALNKERAQEETRGLVHWLRPDYQIPRFGSAKDKAELDLVGGAMPPGLAASAAKSSFPSDDVAQTAAIMATLAAAPRPLDAIMLSSAFKQGRRIAPKVDATLAALVRAGYVARVDGGAGFVLHR